ncbi:hypothetical protein, partial [Desertivirga arenae]|uniref:hypothetical protein n=1 Tax=Desertivirga arenae TaxID=2810309 RepID=UPI001A96F6FB
SFFEMLIRLIQNQYYYVMNQQVLKKYQLTFATRENGDKIIKETPTSYIASFISEFQDVDTIDEIISDINLCLNDQYDAIDDPDWSTKFQEARLYPDGLYFDGTPPKIPLGEFRELMISWKEFLQQ